MSSEDLSKLNNVFPFLFNEKHRRSDQIEVVVSLYSLQMKTSTKVAKPATVTTRKNKQLKSNRRKHILGDIYLVKRIQEGEMICSPDDKYRCGHLENFLFLAHFIINSNFNFKASTVGKALNYTLKFNFHVMRSARVRHTESPIQS